MSYSVIAKSFIIGLLSISSYSVSSYAAYNQPIYGTTTAFESRQIKTVSTKARKTSKTEINEKLFASKLMAADFFYMFFKDAKFKEVVNSIVTQGNDFDRSRSTKCTIKNMQAEYKSKKDTFANYYVRHRPEEAALWLTELDFIIKVNRKIYYYPEVVEFDVSNFKNSSALKALTTEEVKKLESLFYDKRFSRLLRSVGLPGLIEKKTLTNPIDTMPPYIIAWIFKEADNCQLKSILAI